MHRLLASEPVAAAGKPLAGSLLPAMLLALGALVIIAVLVRLVRRRAAATSESGMTPRQRIEAIRAGEAGASDAHAVEARLLETAQRLAGQLDAKADRLEQLIAAADERIEALGARAGGAAQQAAPTVARSRRDEAAHPPDPLTAAVYEMADLGRDPVEIARALDEQIGKVELILALRQ
jgi:hypothetical protein